MAEADQSDFVDQLTRLAKLRADGALSDDEYKQLKTKLLKKEFEPTPTLKTMSERPLNATEMTLARSVKTCFEKVDTFSGRASRSEYWWFVLFYVATMLFAAILDNMLGKTFTLPNGASAGFGFVFLFTAIFGWLPSISVQVRRLHDTDRSGWWYWINAVPFIGPILLIIWSCERGTEGENRFGMDPLEPRM